MKHPIWISYPVPALIYDAEQGVTLSRLLVFHYFVALTKRKKQIPEEVQRFVSDNLEETLNRVEHGDASAAKNMFNPSGKKLSTVSPLHVDVYRSLKGSNEERFAAMSALGLKNAKKAYKAQKAREERINHVQDLLDKKRAAEEKLDGADARRIIEELIEIYKNPSELI